MWCLQYSLGSLTAVLALWKHDADDDDEVNPLHSSPSRKSRFTETDR